MQNVPMLIPRLWRHPATHAGYAGPVPAHVVKQAVPPSAQIAQAAQSDHPVQQISSALLVLKPPPQGPAGSRYQPWNETVSSPMKFSIAGIAVCSMYVPEEFAVPIGRRITFVPTHLIPSPRVMDVLSEPAKMRSVLPAGRFCSSSGKSAVPVGTALSTAPLPVEFEHPSLGPPTLPQAQLDPESLPLQ